MTHIQDIDHGDIHACVAGRPKVARCVRAERGEAEADALHNEQGHGHGVAENRADPDNSAHEQLLSACEKNCDWVSDERSDENYYQRG